MSNRKRNNEVKFRLSDSELQMFDSKVTETGLTKQDYLLTLVRNTKVPDKAMFEALKMSNRLLSEIYQRIRKVEIDVQMTVGNIDTDYETQIKILSSEICTVNEELRLIRKEVLQAWQSLRWLMETNPQLWH